MDHVLVTGGAGYIGSHVAKALERAGFFPIILDDFSRGHRWAAKWGKLVEGNVGDSNLLSRTFEELGISAIIHLAGYAYVSESIDHPQKYFENNVGSTLTLLKEGLLAGVRYVVFSSSCATYGVPLKLPITECAAQNPISPYGETKLMVEKILRWYREVYGLHSVSLRYFNAAGADSERHIGESHDPETHLIPLAIKTALDERLFLDVHGADYDTYDGTAIRDYVHVSDLADAHVKALRYLLAGGVPCAFNLGSGRGFSVREVIRSVQEVSGRHLRVRLKDRRIGDPPVLVASFDKARYELGWQPKVPGLNDIVRSAWEWHLSQSTLLFPTDA